MKVGVVGVAQAPFDRNRFPGCPILSHSPIESDPLPCSHLDAKQTHHHCRRRYQDTRTRFPYPLGRLR